MNNSDLNDALERFGNEIRAIRQRNVERAKPLLPTSDLVAIDKLGRWLAAIRRLSEGQFAILALTTGRYSIVSNLDEAIRNFDEQVSWSVLALDQTLDDWEGHYRPLAELNAKLVELNWDQAVRSILCRHTPSWPKEQRRQRWSIVLGIIALLLLPLSYWGMDFRPLVGLVLIIALIQWLRGK
jgi:hypothetical protein